MTEFGNTRRGIKFYEADVPRIASALERIATGLEAVEERRRSGVPAFMAGQLPHDPNKRLSHFAHARGTMRLEMLANEGLMGTYISDVVALLNDMVLNQKATPSTRNEAARKILELIFGFNE